MTLLTQLAQSTLAARLATIVLLAALAGLVTDAVLKISYGTPAPLSAPALAVDAAKPVPAWLAGGDAAAAAPSDLKLLGVIAQGASGIALVQQTGKRAQVLHVGQRLPDGTLLKSVQGKTATVLVNNENRTLTLDTLGGAPLAVNTAAPMPMPSVPMPAVNMPAVNMPDLSAQTALQMQMQQVQQLQQLQQAAVSEGQAASATAEPSAVGSLKRRLGGRP